KPGERTGSRPKPPEAGARSASLEPGRAPGYRQTSQLLLREAGKVSPKATDGVWKAGMVRRRFAVTVVQSDLGRSSGPHPIRRHRASKDGRLSTPYGATFPSKLGKGSARRFEMCEYCRSPAEAANPFGNSLKC